MAVPAGCDLFVAVRGVGCRSMWRTRIEEVAGAPTLHKSLRAKICAGWSAEDGDVLEVLATLKVMAGVHTNYSLARSEPFIVCI